MHRITFILATVVGTQVHADAVPPDCGIYTYKAEIIRVVDGDTVEANIDLGFNIWVKNEHLRLNRIDAPENKIAEGRHVTQVLRERIEGKNVYVCTHKMTRKDREAKGSFGRYLVEIYDDGANVNDWLLDSGMAVLSEK